MNDVIGLAVERAVCLYGNQGDGLFNAAGFSQALNGIAGVVNAPLDGRVVRAILTGRSDVEPLGEGMFRKLARCST